MFPLLKIMLFPLIAGVVGLLGYRAYRTFNERINASRTLTALLWNTFLLVAINAVLLFGGIIVLVRVYEWLS